MIELGEGYRVDFETSEFCCPDGRQIFLAPRELQIASRLSQKEIVSVQALARTLLAIDMQDGDWCPDKEAVRLAQTNVKEIISRLGEALGPGIVMNKRGHGYYLK